MISAVDTNILLDVLLPDKKHAGSSRALLNQHKKMGQLVICEMVYAELASQFPSAQILTRFLTDTAIVLLPSLPTSLSTAGERWRRYASDKSRAFQCSRCGFTFSLSCPRCGNELHYRCHIISDFLIGAHASNQAGVLLSRDRGFYRPYFPELRVISEAGGIPPS